MPASAATRDYQRAQVVLRALNYRDVAILWRSLDGERLDDSFPRFASSCAQLISTRREMSANLARRYLVAQRVGVPGSAPVVKTPPLPTSVVLTELRFRSVIAVKKSMIRKVPLDRAMRNALVLTMGAVDKLVGDGGRELIRASVEADPLARGWIRRTLGTCDFCAKEAAGNHMQPGDANFPRHDHCGCQPEPVYEQRLAPEQEYVDRIVAALRADKTTATEDQLRAALAAAETKPLSKVNISAAFDRLEADRVAEIARVDAAQAVAAARASERAEGAFLSRGQYDAMTPDSTWTPEKRERILSELRQTREGKILADTLERFQDGGNIARLRTKIDQYLAGGEIDATSKARAEALLNAIRHSPDWAPDTLYRGMTVRGKLDTVLAKYQAGDPLDLNLTSFSSDRKVAAKFQNMTAKGGNETRVMVELVGEGKRTIPIQNLPGDRRLFKEKEWVSAGRYEIVEVKKVSGSVLVRIQQIGAV